MRDTLRWAYAPEPVERPAGRLRPARGPAAGAQDRLRLRVRHHRAGVGHRSLGQHQPARGHPAQPRQPRGLPRLPAPGEGAGRLQHVLGPAGSPRRRKRATRSAPRPTPPTPTRSSSGRSRSSTSSPASAPSSSSSARSARPGCPRRSDARRDQGHRRRVEPDRRAGLRRRTSGSPCTTTAWAPCTREAELTGLLDATDPATVGLALDTAELTVGGIDPVAFYREHADRVTHVHLKDTRYADTGEEYRMPGAESTMLKGGAGRRIERWFFELGTEGGLVDVPGFVAALRERELPGLGRRRERPRRQPGRAGDAQQLVPAARARGSPK